MDEINKKQKSDRTQVFQDRVTLTPLISQKLTSWIDQLNEKYKGLIDVNKSDLVNFFLEGLPESLNRDQIEKLKKVYYDEVRFMQWALQKIKESKKNGTELSLKDLMQISEMKYTPDVKRTRRLKSTESTEMNEQNESESSKNSNNESINSSKIS